MNQVRHGEILVLTIDNPPVNALSPGIPEELEQGIMTAAVEPDIRGIVIIGAGRTFIAGADIREFGKVTSGEKPWVSLLPPLRAIEDCPKPVVMAIHGTALGGGLETAMSGHYRVAVASAKLGQPEVDLGLIPGAGGTQRLPRLVGVPKALEMCSLGQPITAQDAAASGLVDRIVAEDDLLGGAIAFAQEVGGRTPLATRDRDSKLVATPEIFAHARSRAAELRPGQAAPQAAIDAVEAATQLPFEDGCRLEEELFLKCMHSDQSKAMIYVFFGDREVKKRQVNLDAIAERLRNRDPAEWAAEGDQILAEDQALRPVDIDLACVRKLGYPVWRGGPLFSRNLAVVSKNRS